MFVYELRDSGFEFSCDQGDDCRTSCLLNYLSFKENYKLIAIDLSEKQKLDPDPKAM